MGTKHSPVRLTITARSKGVETGSPSVESPRRKLFRWPEKWPRPPKLSRPPRILLLWLAVIVGALAAIWIGLNLMMANPRFATPIINWSLSTFGGQGAHIVTGKLSQPFSNKLEM